MSNFVSWSYNGEIEYGYAPDEKNRIGDYHLEGVEFDRKRFNNEEVCDIVGFHFTDMLKDNPKLVEWLIGELETNEQPTKEQQ